MLVAADLERLAAVEQLFTLGAEVGVPVLSDGKDPVKVAKSALKEAERKGSRRRDRGHRGSAPRGRRDDEAGAPDPRRREARPR